MNFMSNKVNVIPCSGMGKVHGLLAREMALKVVQELCPDISQTECLAYIVTGDQEVGNKIQSGQCITIDGCPLMCAAKSVNHAGGVIAQELRVLDALKSYRGVKPGTATALNEAGWKIVDETAEKIAMQVKEIYGEE
ncbi:putative zinc-binding protein [Dehalobacterium formicoaceticum]|uniref:Zinc-binding protein n=2 Tax=Dehalobacterium formicoaceticum TaxID=51515 RepID=A0ABT1Y1D5_9FIRM|nr:putative zinc-binding protein [Dehalobacterium formicoaceticum]MCR6544679.1 putative zinc-binding protein [Dehalobacterium formicoaceticum]